MFDGASIFDQDLSSWDFCEMDFTLVFSGTPMRDEYYPVGCDSQSPSGVPTPAPIPVTPAPVTAPVTAPVPAPVATPVTGPGPCGGFRRRQRGLIFGRRQRGLILFGCD